MATLTNVLIKNSYDALLKATDNDPIGSTAKRITDGLGNNTPLFISSTQVGIGITPTTELHTNSDAKIGGNLIVVGNLEVQGTTTTIDTATLSVEDPLIILASNNTSDASDIGFYGKYRPSSTDLYSGLFRDASDEKYHLFKNLQTEPTTTVNKSGTGYAAADLVVGVLESTSVSISGDGSNATTLTESGSGDFTIDTVADINLDAGGGDVIFLDDGTEIGRFTNTSSDLVIKSAVQDKDILFKGNDEGSEITALTLDMSGGGTATFSDRILTSDGTVGSPAIAFSADSDTGIYRTASNAINFGTNGSERMRITNTGLGIGTNSPVSNVEISDSTQATGSTLSITNAHSGSWASGDKIGSIDFRINDASTTEFVRAKIHTEGLTTGTFPSNSQLVFSTTDGNTLSEAMRLTNAGRLGLGTNSPDHILCIEDSEPTLRIFDTDNTLNQEQTIAFGTEPGDRTQAEIAGINLNTGNAEGGLVFKTNSGTSLAETARITSTGLGLGTSPDTNLHISTAMSSSPSSIIYLDNSGSNTAGGGGAIIFNSSSSAGTTTNFNASIKGVRDSNDNGSSELQFFTTHQATDNAASKRVVISSQGNVLMNCTSVPSGSGGGAAFETSGTLMRLKQSANSTSSIKLQIYYNSNGEVGSIATSGSATAFNTSSDYRLKENVVDMTDALERVDNLKPKRFNFIADADTTVDGFIAHEVSDIVPEAITGEKDGTYEHLISEEVIAQDAIEWDELPTMDNTKIEIQDWLNQNSIDWQSVDTKQDLIDRIPEYKQEAVEGQDAVYETRPDYQGIDQSKLVPLLVGAIKELKARIEVLENS